MRPNEAYVRQQTRPSSAHIMDDGLSPVQDQAIIWTNVVLLLIPPLGINFSPVGVKTRWFPFQEINSKLSSVKMAAILSRLQRIKMF